MADGIPVVAVEGDAQARGRRHGEALADAIGRCIELYAGLFGLPEARVREAAAGFEATVRAWSPELAREIDAIADGAGQPRHWLWALNARSEIVSHAAPAATASECTAVLFDDTGVVGQTWDWLEPLEALVAVLDVRRPDGHRLLTVTEPGIVGKIGLASSGVGVCLNFLRSPHALTGVPVHVLLRAVLDAADLGEARERIASAGPGRSAHVLVGCAEGGGFGVEFTGREALELAPSAGRLAHTNHFLRSDIDVDPDVENSRARLERADAAASAAAARDWLGLARILSEQREPHPICVPFREKPGWRTARLGTVCAVVMDLPARRMHLRHGPDPHAPWRTLELADTSSAVA